MATSKSSAKKSSPATKKKVTAKKAVKTTAKPALKRASKKKVIATKKVKAKAKPAKALSREDEIKNLFPATMTKAEKLNSVLEHCEYLIYDIVRDTLKKAFNTYDYEFDELAEWLDSRYGAEFLNTSALSSAIITSDILNQAVGQFEVDSWNEDHASLTKTARYVFDSSYSLFDWKWYKPALDSPTNL
jgi:hypothetical protein